MLNVRPVPSTSLPRPRSPFRAPPSRRRRARCAAVHRVELGRHVDDAAPALFDHQRCDATRHLVGGEVVGLDDGADDVVRHLPEFLRLGPAETRRVDRREGEAGVLTRGALRRTAPALRRRRGRIGRPRKSATEGGPPYELVRRRLPLRGFAANSSSVLSTLPKVVNQACPHSPDNSVIFEQRPTLGFSRLSPAP